MDKLRDYFSPLIKRICQAAQIELRNTDQGAAIVTLRILMSREGLPIVWTVSDCVKIEPEGRAIEFLEAMSGEGR